MRVEYHPAIEHELQEIIDYYNRCSMGLGTEFLDEFERQVLKISSIPKRWTIVDDGIRRSLLKRFPYVIYFRDIGDNVLRVLVVKHQRRHPDYGRKRK